MLKMYREKAVTEKEYLDFEKIRAADQETLVLAKKNLDLVKNPFRPEEIRAQEAKVRLLEADLILATKNLQLVQLCSPIEGRYITASPAQTVGQYLEVGDLLGVVEDARNRMAEIEVCENDVEEVKVGAKVKLKAWAYPTRSFTGKVISIAPVGYNQVRGKSERVLTEKEHRNMPIAREGDKVIRVITTINNIDDLLRTDMTGYAKVSGSWKPAGVAYTRWLMRFVLVTVWSWIP